MLKDVTSTCPRCGQETVLAVAAPDPGSDAEKATALTTCRKCKARIIAVTHADGTVDLGLWEEDAEPQPLRPATTLNSVFGLAEVLRIPFALWRPRGEAIGEFKHRPEWAQALSQALRDAQAKPRPLSVPRRIFVSYRWQSDHEDAWVAALGRELRARGNLVVFDRDAQREARPPSVPELVARIANCHVFLAVLDPGYMKRVVAVESAPMAEGWRSPSPIRASSRCSAYYAKATCCRSPFANSLPARQATRSTCATPPRCYRPWNTSSSNSVLHLKMRLRRRLPRHCMNRARPSMREMRAPRWSRRTARASSCRSCRTDMRSVPESRTGWATHPNLCAMHDAPFRSTRRSTRC
jgi:hypothetical protein